MLRLAEVEISAQCHNRGAGLSPAVVMPKFVASVALGADTGFPGVPAKLPRTTGVEVEPEWDPSAQMKPEYRVN